MVAKRIVQSLLGLGMCLAVAGVVWPGSVAASVPAVPLSFLHMNDARVGWAMSMGTGALLRTADGGLHWRDVTPLLLTSGTAYVVADYYSPQRAWIAVQQASTLAAQIVRTDDGGQTWSSVPLVWHVQGASIRQIVFINPQDGWIFAASGGEAGQGFEGEIFRTTDGGQHWASETHGHWSVAQPGLAFRTARDGMLPWFGTVQALPVGKVGLSVTHDGGHTWHAADVPLPAAYRQAAVMPDVPEFFTERDGVIPLGLHMPGADLRRFLVTHDGGRTWHLMPAQGLGSGLPGSGIFSTRSTPG